MPKLLLILLAILLPRFVGAQPNATFRDFRQVDSISRTITYKKDIYRLTKELTASYSDKLFKVRAIFIWITHNIRYDCKFANKDREIKAPECKSGADCEQVLQDWENNYLKKVLKKKKAICDGYARLFKKMCEIARIKTEIVEGYTKSKPYQVGLSGPLNHAWNAVWLDSAYFLLDPTWAAGYCIEDEETGKLLKFVESYDDYYWMTSFHDLARNHYPKDGKWVLEPNYTKEKYAANPYYTSNYLGLLHLITPSTGIINAKVGDTIHFKFDYKREIQRLQVNSNVYRNPDVLKWEKVSKRQQIERIDTLALKKQRYVSFKQDDDVYEFYYIIPENSLEYLDILFDYRRVMRFRFKIKTAAPN